MGSWPALLLLLVPGCGGALETDPLAPIPTEVDEREIEPPSLRVEWKHTPRSSGLVVVPAEDEDEEILFPPPTQPPAIDSTLVYSVHHDLIRAYRLRDGLLRWEVRVAAEIVLPPLPIAGGIAVASAEGRWLWVDLTGRLRAVSEPTDPSTDAVALPRGIVAVDGSSVALIDTSQLADASLVRWRRPLPGARVVSGALDGQTAIAVTDEGLVAALAIDTGDEIWRNEEIEALSAGAAVDGQRVFVVGQDARIHALRLRNGKRAWRSKETGVPVVGAPATVGGLVWIAGLDAALHAYDVATGSHMHRVRLSGRSFLDLATWGSWVVASPEYGPWTLVRAPLFANGPADPGQPRSYTIESSDDLILAPGSGSPGVILVDASGELKLLRPRAQPLPPDEEEAGRS